MCGDKKEICVFGCVCVLAVGVRDIFCLHSMLQIYLFVLVVAVGRHVLGVLGEELIFQLVIVVRERLAFGDWAAKTRD